jgi:gluconolactonase
MNKILGLVSASIVLLSGGNGAISQIAPTTVNAKVEIAEATAKTILPDNLVVEKLATGFKFTEGPLWTREGYLIFSDIPANAIYRLDPDGKTSVFLENSGYLGEAPAKGARGSNGITYDREGNIIFTQHGDRAVVRLTRDGKKEKIVASYDGKRLNSPNDLVVKSNGAIYFTN